jgi:hypothetical protein
MRLVDGEEGDSRYLPVAASRMICRCSSHGMVLFRAADGMPAASRCAAWSFMSAISGDTTMQVPPRTTAGN